MNGMKTRKFILIMVGPTSLSKTMHRAYSPILSTSMIGWQRQRKSDDGDGGNGTQSLCGRLTEIDCYHTTYLRLDRQPHPSELIFPFLLASANANWFILLPHWITYNVAIYFCSALYFCVIVCPRTCSSRAFHFILFLLCTSPIETAPKQNTTPKRFSI